MKKSAKVAVGVATVLVAGTALTWYSGKHIETSLTEMRQLLEKEALKGISDQVKVIEVEYTRGFTSSAYSYVVQFEFGDKIVKAKFSSQIKHGPFFGLCFGMGSSEDELILLDAPKEVTDLLGGNKLMTARTVYSLSGETYTAYLPDINWKDADTSDPFSFVLNGAKAHGYMSYDLKKSLGDLFVKQISIASEKVNASIDGISVKAGSGLLDGATDKPCNLFTCLNTGSQEIHVDRIGVKNGDGQAVFAMENFAYNLDWPKKNDFVDMIVRVGAKSLQVKGKEDEKATEFGPAQYDISLRHLQANPVAKLYSAYMDIYTSALPSVLKEGSRVESALAAQLALQLVPPGLEILKQSPEIRVDRIHFMTPQGEVDLSASVTIKDFKESDVAQQPVLMNKIEAEFTASAPTELVKKFANHTELEAGKKEGYLSEEKGILSTKVTFRNGELNFNGKVTPIPVAGGFISGLIDGRHDDLGDEEESVSEESDETEETR